MLMSLTHPGGMGQCTAELDRFLEKANDEEGSTIFTLYISTMVRTLNKNNAILFLDLVLWFPLHRSPRLLTYSECSV